MIGFACGIKSEVQNAYLKIRAKFFRSDFVIEAARFRKSNCAGRSLFLEVTRIVLLTSFIALLPDVSPVSAPAGAVRCQRSFSLEASSSDRHA